MTDLGTDKILFEKTGATALMTINNPERRNAISLEMWEAMRAAIGIAEADPEIRSLVMKGAGDKAFASGADISQFDKNRSNADAAAEYARIAREARMVMMRFEKPLIAMIRGFCMGGGLGIAMTADVRIASDDSWFGIPAGKLGIAYDEMNLTNLVNLIGPARAKEILFSAKRYTGAEAYDMGLINTVVSVADLQGAVDDLTGRIAENAPLSLKASKLTIDELIKDAANRDAALMDSLYRACFDSADYQEGRKAFAEKRAPVFKGE